MNESRVESSKDVEEISFYWVNSDDELETHERDGSPVVWMSTLDQTFDTLNYQTHQQELNHDLHERITMTNSPGKSTDWA